MCYLFNSIDKWFFNAKTLKEITFKGEKMIKKLSSKKFAIVAFLLVVTMASMAFLAPAYAATPSSPAANPNLPKPIATLPPVVIPYWGQSASDRAQQNQALPLGGINQNNYCEGNGNNYGSMVGIYGTVQMDFFPLYVVGATSNWMGMALVNSQTASSAVEIGLIAQDTWSGSGPPIESSPQIYISDWVNGNGPTYNTGIQFSLGQNVEFSYCITGTYQGYYNMWSFWYSTNGGGTWTEINIPNIGYTLYVPMFTATQSINSFESYASTPLNSGQVGTWTGLNYEAPNLSWAADNVISGTVHGFSSIYPHWNNQQNWFTINTTPNT